MSMKAMLLAAATAATLLVPAVASAQDWGHNRNEVRRDDRRIEARREYGAERRGYDAYSYGYGYGYDTYPAYGYAETYRYDAPAWRDRDDRRGHRWTRDRDHGRRF